MRKATRNDDAAWEKGPEEAACCDPFFSWVFPTFRMLRRSDKLVQVSDLPNLPRGLLPAQSARVLEKYWAEERDNAKNTGRSPSLFRTLFRLVGKRFAVSVAFIWVSVVMNLAIAILTGLVVQAVDGEIRPLVGYVLGAGFFLCVVLGGICSQQAQHNQANIAIMASGSLNAMVFRKLALITSKERAKYSDGQIINFSAVDCQTVLEVTLFLAFFALIPVQFIICVVFLSILIGPAFALGFGVLAINVFAVERVGDNVKKLQVQKNQLADQRNIYLNEALQGIRTIKLLAWESAFLGRIHGKRDLEMSNLRTAGFRRALQAFLSFGLPTVATVATFILYVTLGNDLDSAVVFTSLGLFEFLNMAMVIFPNALNELRRLEASIQRLEMFLGEEDTYVQSENTGEHVGVVAVQDGAFFWSDEQDADTDDNLSGEESKSAAYGKVSTSEDDVELAPKSGGTHQRLTLQNINLRAEKGQLLAVVGTVSSGKTTLANALLGLIGKASGSVFIGGRTAFVAQHSFVMNDSVRENIIFRGDYDEAWYKECVRAACLEHDLKAFVAGDQTQVGERGITISGGQKQRVSLARAAYFKPDVVILDDPLSAMDAHVGRELFDNLILRLWREQGVTVILITNQLWVCDRCDEIVLLDEGRVREAGTYAELTSKDGPGRFRELMASVTGSGDAPAPGSDSAPPSEPHGSPELRSVIDEEGEAKDGTVDDTDASQSSANESVAVQGGGVSKANAPAKNGALMSTEARTAGRVGFGTVLDLIRAADAPFLGAAVIFVTVASPVVQWMVGWALARWADTYDDDSEVPVHESVWLYVYVGLGFCFGLLAAARSGYYNWFFVCASTVLHNKMLASVFRSPMSLFDTTPVGRILNRFQQDMTILDIMLPRLFELWSFLTGVCVTAIILAGVLVPHVLPAAVALIVFGLYMYKVVGAVVLELRKLNMISASPVLASLSGFLNGLDSIRAFGRTEAFATRQEQAVGNFLSAFYWMRTVEHWVNAAVVSPVVGLFLGALAVAVVGLRGTSFVNASTAGLVLSYASLLGLRIPAVMFITTTMEQLLTSVQRLVEYINLTPEPSTEMRDGKGNLHLDNWPADGSIVAHDLKLRYREELPLVLKGVSFKITDGQRVGIVGRTGAGKSTLNLAAFRMAPIADGSLSIGGVDVRDVPLELLRDRVGMIPQDAFLFSGTVRENLDPFQRHSDEDIYAVLDLVSIGKYVRELKHTDEDNDKRSGASLDFFVDEGGNNFSSGMVQLLCMARVLLRRPKVVFMDEATASVDMETDLAVQRAIREGELGLGGSTLLVVAHRLNTVIDFDAILVMSDGRVAEFAHPHDLLRNPKSIFSSLVDDTGAQSAAELRSRAEAAFKDRRKAEGA